MNRTAKQMRVYISLYKFVYRVEGHNNNTASIFWSEIKYDSLFSMIYSDNKLKTLILLCEGVLLMNRNRGVRGGGGQVPSTFYVIN